MSPAKTQRPALLVLLLLAPAAVHASDLDDCRSTGTITNAARLKACNAVIDSDTVTGTDLATAYYRRGALAAGDPGADPKGVMADFDKAIELDPKFTEAYTFRGLVHSRQMKFDAAIADYTKAIALSPDRWSLYYLRGMAYAQKQDLKSALADDRAALAHNPPANSADMIRNRIAEYEKKLGL